MRKLIRITTVPISFFGLLKGQLRFMSDKYEVLGITSPGDLIPDITQNEGVPFIPVEMTRTISPLKDLKAVWQLYKVFKKEKPFIVHTHTPKAGTLGMFAAKLAGVPHRLHTIAGLPLMEATGKKRKLLDVVEKATYSCATMIYPNSKGLEEVILQNKYTVPSKLKVLGKGSSNGIDTSYFSPDNISVEIKDQLKKDLGIQNHDFVFIFIGRLVGDKGVNELVQAFQRLSEEVKNIKLLLVGPLEEDLDALAEETMKDIKSNINIIFTGFVKDVRPYLAVSDCLVFPSYREGFPNVVMQAGAMGLPSIVSDINGCNEIILQNQNGTIIPVKNTEAVYQEMKRYCYEKDWVAKLQSNARQLIVSRYEQQVVWDAILAEYIQLEKRIG